MQSANRFFDKIGIKGRLALFGVVLLQPLFTLSADTPLLYRNNLKNRNFDKEAPQNLDPERATIAERQGASEDRNSEVKPTQSKTDSSSCLGIDKQENLALRKITEYWREGNYTNVKTHIFNYLTTYPTSPYLSELYAMLGDLYFKEEAYEEALSIYDKITTPSVREFISLRYMETLFALNKYEDAIRWGRDYPLQTDDKPRENRFLTLRAESLYRVAMQMEPGQDREKITREALEIYKCIPDDSAHRVALAIAHLYALIEECDMAASLYLELAASIPEKQEELYFRAASQLTTSQPATALALYQKVLAKKGALFRDALFNRLILLYKQKNFAKFIEEYDHYLPHLTEEHISLLLFCRSISLFQLDRFAESVAPLQTLIQTNTLSILQTRRALLSLFFCAQKTSDLELITRCLQIWSERLYLDEDYLQGLFVRVQIALERQEITTATATLKEILERFPDCAEHESVLFDYAQSLASDKKWTDARENFQQFLKEYTSSASTPFAWQHLIFCSMQLLKEGSAAEKDALKGCLVMDLQAALATTPPLDAETTRVYKRGIAQLNFELGRHQEALAQAEDYIQNYPEDRDTQSMRLMAITCLTMLHAPSEDLIAIAEKAFAHETDPQTQGQLRLTLFNAYLNSEKDKEIGNEKAGEHLLAVYQAKTATIKKENLLWLADFLLKNEEIASLSVAIAVLEDALQFNGQELEQVDRLDPRLLESYTLRLADLYERTDLVERAATLLSSLVSMADRAISAGWEQRRQVLFSLAGLEEKLGRKTQALLVYTRLIDEATYASASYYRPAALLKRAKLQYDALTAEEKCSDSLPLLNILDTLKELQITKNIHSEPIHLEAALDYASMRSALVAASEQVEKKLFYLEKIREDFLSQTDDINLKYHEERLALPEKEIIFRAYMQFIDLEIKQCNLIMSKETCPEGEVLSIETEITLGLKQLLSLPSLAKTPLAARVHSALKILGIPL